MRAWCTAAPHSSKRGRNATLRLGTALSCFSTINQIVAQDIMGLRTYFLLKSVLCLWWFFLFQNICKREEPPYGSASWQSLRWEGEQLWVMDWRKICLQKCAHQKVFWNQFPSCSWHRPKTQTETHKTSASEDKQGNLNHCSKKIFSSFLLHRSHISSADPLAYLASCPTPLPPSPEDHKNIFDLQKIEHT